MTTGHQAGTFETIGVQIAILFTPLASRLANGEILPVLAELGLQFPPQVIEDSGLLTAVDACVVAGRHLADASQRVVQASDANDLVTLATAVVDLVTSAAALLDSVEDLATAISNAAAALPDISPAELAAFISDLPRRLIDLAIVTTLEDNLDVLAGALDLFGIIERTEENIGSTDPVHPQFTRVKLRLDRLPQLLSPGELLADLYGWGTATFDGDALFERLSSVLSRANFPAFYDRLAIPPVLDLIVAEVRVAPAVPEPGLAIRLRTAIEEVFQSDDESGLTWSATVRVRAPEGSELIVTPDGNMRLAAPGESTTEAELRLHVEFEPADPPDPVVVFGQQGGTRLQIRKAKLDASTALVWQPGAGAAVGEAEIVAAIEQGELILTLAEGDGFLQTLVPSARKDDGAQFSLEVGLQRSGFFIRGSAALALTIPVHRELGPVKIQQVTLSLRPDADRLIGVATASLLTQLGPIQVFIDGVGIELAASFPEERGNFGPLNLEVGFKPPTALGLSINGGGFKGGGFIGFDPEDESYAGMLELEFQDLFTLKAFGLLTTHLPNKQKGFSLLIVISSEFTPIQLGLGFKLNGVGGLLGLNRTVNVEPLRAGLRANTLSSILFPTDIVANADRIISDLKQVFPPQADRFIFGPMAKIAWGTPTLVTVDLGLVIEIPDPVRLFILGVLRAVLPDERAAILRVQVNFLGEINFARRQLKFDASLFDSKLLAFTLTGDMAIRLDWGADANFLLTVGGCHPAYEPPPMDLPAIRRLTLSLLEGDNPRLKLEMYFAVTSNTAQFGAKLELYAAAWKFNVYGFLSFDVLFQFSPFYFIAEITAMLALRIGSSSFASIKLSLTLEGPTPWKAQGTARFKICWFFTLKVRFNKTFGEARNTTLPDLAVLPLLAEALRADDNWEGELPSQRHRLESVRKAPEITSELLLHPVGTLKISQKVVPLNVRIDRIGSQRPSDAREFRITQVQPEATLVTPQEAFAPAQFFDLTDEEKLTSASFKDFDSGLRIGDAERLHTGYAAARQVNYELKYIDSQGEQRLRGPKTRFDVDAGAFNTWTLQGAIAQSELSFARTRKSSLAPEAVVVSQESFAIVNSGDLKLFDELSLLGSESAAAARLNELIETNPTLRDTLQVVPAFERAA